MKDTNNTKRLISVITRFFERNPSANDVDISYEYPTKEEIAELKKHFKIVEKEWSIRAINPRN